MIPFLGLLSIGLGSSTGVVELVPYSQSVQPGKPVQVGLLFHPAQGYHTYWRNAGDSGSPAEIKWKLGPGWKVNRLDWPIPEKLVYSGIVSYGYDSPALVLATLTPPASLKAGSVAHISAKVDWMTCTPQACTPATGNVSLALKVGEAATGMPTTDADKYPAKLAGWTATARKSGSSIVLTLRGGPKVDPLQGPYFFAQEAGVVSHGGDQIFSPLPDGVTVKLPVSEYANRKLTRLVGVLKAGSGETWDGRHAAFQIDVPIVN